MTKLYEGRRAANGCEILADGKKLSLRRSLAVANHSPTGFEWGYGGSGPAQSALAILLDHTGGKRNFCERFHQDFKWKMLSSAPKDGWEITGEQIQSFIIHVKIEEAAQGRALCDACLCVGVMHSEKGRCLNEGCDCGKKKRGVV